MSAIGYEFCDGVSWSTLAAPDAGNPFTMPMAEQLLAAVQRSRRDDAHVTVLRAQGRAFSVGGDVKAFAGAEDPGRFVQDLAEVLHRAVSDLHRHDTVVVSAVQGVAAGAGFSLAAAADVVLAVEAATGRSLSVCRTRCSPPGRRRPRGSSTRWSRTPSSRQPRRPLCSSSVKAPASRRSQHDASSGASRS